MANSIQSNKERNKLLLLAQAQHGIASIILARGELKEYDADWLINTKKVVRDYSGRFASKVSNINLFGLDVQKAQNQAILTDEEAMAALDRMKEEIEALKASKEPLQSKNIASKIMTDGIPTIIYIGNTFGPDIAIGLALGESLPIILGGAAVYALISKVAQDQLKEWKVEDPWIQAGVNIAISLFSADLAKKIAVNVKAFKLGSQGVRQIVENGKNADDLKNTFSAVHKDLEALKNPAKTALEKTRQERFLHALSLTAQNTADKPIGSFFANVAEYAGGLMKPSGENLAQFIETELQGVGKALTESGVDAKAFSKRLAELSDLSKVPILHRAKRVDYVKTLVQRAKEIPQALKNVNSPEIKEIEDFMATFFQKVGDGIRSGENPKDVLNKLEWPEAVLKSDRANELKLGAKWRTQLLNAEIKKGKILDGFVNSIASSPKKLRDRYEAFLGSLVKDKPKSTNFTIASDWDFVTAFKNKPQGKIWASEAIRNGIAQECIEAAKLFGRISPVDLNVKIGSFTSRAFHLNGLINVAKGDRTHVWHELTHAVEGQIDKGCELSSAFRHSRISKPGVDDMLRLGMPGEKAIFDNFYSPYVGKLYPKDSTEILTTGVEKMASAEGLHFLGTMDREHLMFVLGTLDG